MRVQTDPKTDRQALPPRQYRRRVHAGASESVRTHSWAAFPQVACCVREEKGERRFRDEEVVDCSRSACGLGHVLTCDRRCAGQSLDLERRVAVFGSTSTEGAGVQVDWDLLVGADGVNSVVRFLTIPPLVSSCCTEMLPNHFMLYYDVIFVHYPPPE